MTPLPWSHSALEGFDTCARQYEEVRVLKHFKDGKNAAALWGDEFHKAAERFIGTTLEGHPAVLPSNMSHYADYLRQFVKRPGATLAERRYALNRQLRPCEFFSPDVWVRGIIDVLTLEGAVAWVDDHKTGKNRKKDMQQLIIFALLTFYHHPEIDTCHTAFHWLQVGATDPETFYRHQIPALWETLVPKLQRYVAAFHAGIFPPRPSGLCVKHCAVSSCEYFGRGSR
jgi:hypothetical protein